MMLFLVEVSNPLSLTDGSLVMLPKGHLNIDKNGGQRDKSTSVMAFFHNSLEKIDSYNFKSLMIDA